jgi:hypothetical protein|nr:MAG TPA: hypothetical protein [Caudoviricetes sp.]
MNIDEVINGWTFEETIKTAKSLMEAETNMFKWDVIRHLRDFVKAYREQLKEYQQLEEQGRLVKLPCKVGDTVWDNDYGRPCAYTITAFSFGECEEYICEPVTTKEVVFYYANSNGSITGSFAESEIGKSVFLNKSEAEAKLKELRGGEDESSN